MLFLKARYLYVLRHVIDEHHHLLFLTTGTFLDVIIFMCKYFMFLFAPAICLQSLLVYIPECFVCICLKIVTFVVCAFDSVNFVEER